MRKTTKLFILPLIVTPFLLVACGGGGSSTSGKTFSSGSSNQKVVFITRDAHSGDLLTEGAGGATTGLEGADNLCNQAADAAGLTGNFKAWVSNSSTDAIDRITDVGPWYSTDKSEKLVESLSPSPDILEAITMDEYENTQFASVWTGTDNDGTKLASTCSDWEATGVTGVYGLSGSTSNWSNNGTASCTSDYHLYCFQQ